MAERAIRKPAGESTGQREDRLLHQSFMDEVTVKALSDGTYAMRSTRTPAGVWYLSTATSCSCPWGQREESPCKHSLRAQFEDSFAVCQTCGGSQKVRKVNRYRPGITFVGICPDCGPKPVVIRRVG